VGKRISFEISFETNVSTKLTKEEENWSCGLKVEGNPLLCFNIKIQVPSLSIILIKRCLDCL
jgi:hypothetical protein